MAVKTTTLSNMQPNCSSIFDNSIDCVEFDPCSTNDDDTSSSCSESDNCGSRGLIEISSEYLQDCPETKLVSELSKENLGLSTKSITTKDLEDPQQEIYSPPLQCRNHDDAQSPDTGAVVHVERLDLGTYGSEFKGTVTTPVADLVRESLDLTQAQVQAVPVDRRFYDQWARLPREEDPEREVTNGSRKPFSLRMLPATGSLKSYTLMSAIVRDKQSPIQHAGDFAIQNLRPSVSAGGAASDGIGTLTGKTVSDSFTSSPARSDSTRSAGAYLRGSRCNEAFPPILDYRAKTAPENPCANGLLNRLLPKALPLPTNKDEEHPRNSHMYGSTSLLGSVRRAEIKSEINRSISGSWRGSSFIGSQSSSSGQRQQQALSMNTASLLFSADIDLRDERYRQFVQKQPRLAVKIKQPAEDAREGSTVHANKGKVEKQKEGACAENKTAEVTCVEFIDLTEVSGLLQGEANGPKPSERRATNAVYTHLASAPARTRIPSRASQRVHGSRSCCDKSLVHKQFVTVGVPIRINDSKSSD